MRVKIENEAGLERDLLSRAVVNTDGAAYNKYIMQRKRLEEKDKEIAEMRSEMQELKQLVMSLIQTIKEK